MAAKLGSDGKGKHGLVGYLVFLAREYPTQFVNLLNKVIKAGSRSKTRTRRSRAHSGSPSRDPEIMTSIAAAADWLGRNGRGRDGMLGYFAALAVNRPKQYVKLLSTLIEVQEREGLTPSESEQQPSFTSEQIKAMTLEEKMAELRKMGVCV